MKYKFIVVEVDSDGSIIGIKKVQKLLSKGWYIIEQVSLGTSPYQCCGAVMMTLGKAEDDDLYSGGEDVTTETVKPVVPFPMPAPDPKVPHTPPPATEPWRPSKPIIPSSPNNPYPGYPGSGAKPWFPPVDIPFGGRPLTNPYPQFPFHPGDWGRYTLSGQPAHDPSCQPFMTNPMNGEPIRIWGGQCANDSTFAASFQQQQRDLMAKMYGNNVPASTAGSFNTDPNDPDRAGTEAALSEVLSTTNAEDKHSDPYGGTESN